MASLKYILLFLSAATYGTYVTASTMKPGYGIVNESENINVTCGEPFTMSCTLNTSVNCTWKRNGAVIKAEDIRYSSQTTNETCTFNASSAELMDNGNWSCGTIAGDDHDGVTSENITVIVTEIPGETCKTVTTVSTDVFIAPPDGDMTKYIYVSVGVLTVLLLIMASALIYVYRSKQKSKRESNAEKSVRFQELHIYEEIDENPNVLLETADTLVQPVYTKIKKQNKQIRVKEVVDSYGYQIPLNRNGTVVIKDGCVIATPEILKSSIKPKADFPEISTPKSDSVDKGIPFKKRFSDKKIRNYEKITSK